ncbi:ABC transporter permease [Fonticella tunisiensis]|uniref:Putative ABC transport system permease protein n=1 Tax=Fonticella tunisiensis TaxID=1096341 RepID=A0A4R7KSS6_9CLOT|nr:FtsX-like permease family protein [Fonticella tunisiensis]TDT62818.1 putative ABC transport system permease protein [Fonticella tunisiensis]
MVINKKIKRTMMESKSQYLGSLMLIIISCLLYTMFNQLTTNMVNLTSSFEKNYVQEDASFIADKKLDNIEDLESRFNMIIEETRSIDYLVSEDKTLRIFSENTKVNIPAIIEGNKLIGSDILIDPAFAKANKLKIGDSINIYGKDLKIAGFMSLPNYIYPIKSESDILNDPNRFGIAVISKDDFNEINKGSSFYTLKFNGDKKDVDNRIAQFKDYLKSENIIILKWTNIDENPRVTYVTLKIDGINQISTYMPVFILLLTCILTGIVMWRMLKREFILIGTLYALGYKKREIVKHYLTYPLSIALAGGIIGTILGAFTLRPMLNFMVMYFNIPVDYVSFDLKYVVISLLLPIFFLGISGYFVVNRALKYSPVELMKGGKEKGKVSFIERKLKLDRLKFSTKFKVREQLRSIPRSVFLLLGVVFATMLLLLGFASKSSMDFLMKDAYEDTYKYQYQYIFNSLQHGAPSNGEVFSISPFTLKSDSKTGFYVYGISPNSKYILLKDKQGNWLSTDKVIITKPLADKLGVKPHDTIKVVNKLDSKEYSITVDYIAETYTGEYIYMPLVEFNDMLKYPSDSYIGLWSSDKLNISESSLLSITTIDDFKKALDSTMQPLKSSIGIMAFISFIIGLIVIYVVTSLIIEENRESISLLKILGYRRKEVYSLILNSSSFIVLIGYILGVPLLLVSLRAMFKSVTKSMNFAFPVTIEYGYVFIGFVVIYLTYELSKFLSRRKINRISMAEALKASRE